MDIILFGMQGSGKGTQGNILSERYHLTAFDMGNELRAMIESGTALGEKIKATVHGGHLVDDDTIMEVVAHFMSSLKPDQQVLFDGIPRTLPQSEKLLALLKQYGRSAFALLIKLSKEEAIKRLTSRRICQACKKVFPASYQGGQCDQCQGALVIRHDDTEDAIKKRLELYEKETKPVINSFYKLDHLIEVDGEQPIEDVTTETIEKVGYLFH